MEELITAAGSINSSFSFYAFLIIYVSTEIAKYFKSRGQNSPLTHKIKEAIADIGEENKKFRDKVSCDIIDVQKNIKRIELINIIDKYPNEKLHILALYDEYKGIGGNSYIDEVFSRWRNEDK